MMIPSTIAAALEMIETEFVFQFAVLLFDRPAPPRHADEVLQRRRRREIQEVRLSLAVRHERALA
jgi:hypothetical protein